jgi:hypothetical protein
MSDPIFPKGINVKKAPVDFIVAKLSICVEDFIAWAKENKTLSDESEKTGKHYFNIDIKTSKKTGDYYPQLNTWKPTDTPHNAQEAPQATNSTQGTPNPSEQQDLIDMTNKDSTEYDDIPF